MLLVTDDVATNLKEKVFEYFSDPNQINELFKS